MIKNLKIFILIAMFLTGGYLAVGDLINHLSSGWQATASLLLIVAFFWINFDLIAKIIYRFAGVELKSKLNHQQAATISNYWNTWLVTAVLTGTIYTLVFDRSHWKGNAMFGGAILVVVGLVAISNRRKIMGHSKKELFQ